MPEAYFRFYASSWRGAGHAMRCLTLAKKLIVHGWTCHFVTEKESYDFVPALQSFSRVEPEEFYNLLPPQDLLVVDHYDCNVVYEQHFRNVAKCIMVIDDIADRIHDCDIILDQAYGRQISDYSQSVPDGCDILVGPAYALLRDEFADGRASSLERRMNVQEIARIFINFGGNDQKNMILEALRALDKLGYDGQIDVVFGVMAPHRESVESFVSTMHATVNFHINPPMATLMSLADIAIGAPAVSAWERFCLGLPTIMLQTADNQSFTYNALLHDGLALGGNLEGLLQKGLLVDFDPTYYKTCVTRCAAQTDGMGAEKILSCINRKLELSCDVQKKTH